MEKFMRRWWVTPWGPFGLVVVGAVILYLMGFNYQDTGPVMVMVMLILLFGAGISQRFGR